MTRNNLSDQLAWLLASRPSIPPSETPLPPVSISFTQAEVSQPQEDPVETSATPGVQEPSVATSVELEGTKVADMARLRTEPGSARSRNLVSVGSRLDPVQNARTGSITPKPSTHAAPPSRATPFSTARQVPHSPQNVEIMDLTQSMEELRSPSASRQAGRKRKSSEMEVDLPPLRKPTLEPTRSAQAMPPPPRASQQSFTAIDEIMEQPIEPPPPYSTFAPGGVSPARRSPKRTGTTVRPTTASRGGPSRILPDSDDDESDFLVDFSRSRSRTPAAPAREPPKQGTTSRDRVIESPHRPGPVPRTESFTLPQKDLEKALRTTFPLDAKTPDGRLGQPSTPAPTTATQGSNTEDRTTVERLFHLSQADIKKACDSLHEESERLVAELCERLENDEDETDLQTSLDNVDERHKAMESLAANQQQYQGYLDERDRHRAALRDAVRARQGQDDAKAAISASKTQIQTFLDGCIEHLKLCRSDVSALLDGARSRTVAVQSTQAPVLQKQPCIPSSSRIAQTQMAKPDCPGPFELEGPPAASRQSERKPPSIDQYFAPPTKTSTSASKQPMRPPALPCQPRETVHEDAFDDLDDEDMLDAHNELFSNNMGSPPARFNDDDEFDVNDDDDYMIEMAESCENSAVQRRPPQQNDHRSALAPTSGNSKVQPPARSPKGGKKRLAAKSDDAKYEELFRSPWGADVKEALRDRFNLKGFRENQLEAINATLAGKDTFVLMPTGGGKSLCYQLPSLIKSGRTRGVTIVISPLLSLMEDQVQHLRKLGIQAFLINSETTLGERNAIMEAMKEDLVEDFIQLLYVTPEMLSKSQMMINTFERLYRRQKLARLVIDEAHCVSQWGHDFRPDYKLLGDVRKRFPNVPVMALTATATENVKLDTVHNLSIPNCQIFTSSFNRPNLFYDVRPKGKGKEDVNGIAELIKGKYHRQTGIIYCLSRKNCETMAAALTKEHKIKAHHYHAGLESEEKSQIQKMWQAGKYHVIVATIAFGMGIDKPDVRFVIHHTIPKSLEGYYQETGRAGRDQLPSGCYLFYGYQDAGKLRRMIDDGDGSWEQKERQHLMLRKMIQYCENKSDCRRVQVLQYFNEQFTQDECGEKCDNCQSTTNFKTVDFSHYAQDVVNLVDEVAPQNVTLLYCMDIFRGALTKKITDNEHNELEQHGAGKDLDRGDIERLFSHLLTERAITEINVVNKKGFANQYVALGKNSHEFRAGRRKLHMQMLSTPLPKSKAPAKKKSKKDVSEEQSKNWKKTAGSRAPIEMPMSTNISSPIQAATSKRKAKKPIAGPMHGNGYQRDGFIVSDPDDDEYGMSDTEETDDGDGFEPIRIAGQRPSEKTRPKPRKPITVDEAMAGLDELERDAVENFVHNAGGEIRKLMTAKSLRIAPFSDTILRQMAIGLTDSEAKMLKIPGIDPDMVTRYGKQFVKLVKQYREHYESMRQQRRPDPNAQNVIVVVSDDEDEEDEESYGGDFSMDEDEGEQSAYFPVNAAVQKFNENFQNSQSAAMRSAGQPKAAKGKGYKKRSYKATGSTGARSRKSFTGSSRYPSNDYSENPPGGVRKRKASNKRSGGESAGNGRGASKRGGGGGGGMIRMMET